MDNNFSFIDELIPKYQEISIEETEPTNEPVTLSEIKLYLKIDFTTDDDLLTALIKAVRKQIEIELGGLLIVKRNVVQKQTGGLQQIELLRSPVNSITSIIYYDSFSSTGSTITSSSYRNVNNRLYHEDNYFKAGRSADGYVITYNAGMVNDTTSSYASSPEAIKTAIKRIIAYLYDNRQMYVSSYIENQLNINFDQNMKNEINLLLMPYHTGKGIF